MPVVVNSGININRKLGSIYSPVLIGSGVDANQLSNYSDFIPTWAGQSNNGTINLALITPNNGLSLIDDNGIWRLGISQASASAYGILTPGNFTTFNNKQNALTFGNLTTSNAAIIISNGYNKVVGGDVSINIPNATNGTGGLLTSSDWIAFNSKGSNATGNLTSSSLEISINGSGNVVGSTLGISIRTANATQSGVVSSADWNTFNNKWNLTSGNLTSSNAAISFSGNGSVIMGDISFNIRNATNGTSGLLTGSDYTKFNSKLDSLTPTAPIAINGTVISIQNATNGTDGYLNSTDYVKFNNKQDLINATSPLILNSTGLKILQANATQSGYLSLTDYNNFTSKQNALTFGNLTTSTSGITISGAGKTTSGDIIINIPNATNGTGGLLSASDWALFKAGGNLTTSSPLSLNGSLITISRADNLTSGYLHSSDYTLFFNKENKSEKGQPFGYAPLDITGKISPIYLPTTGLIPLGAWNATTNTPTLSSGSNTTAGSYYIVSVNGSTSLDGISSWGSGDWIISNGTVWQKISNQELIQSVFGRTGAITAQSGDYNATLISFNSTLLNSTNVGLAILELNSSILSKQSVLIPSTPLTISNSTISITQASNGTSGYITGSDYTLFSNGLNQTAITPLYKNSTDIGILQSNTTQAGYISSTDWNSFNGKQNALTVSTPLFLNGTSLSVTLVNATANGILSSADYLFLITNASSGGSSATPRTVGDNGTGYIKYNGTTNTSGNFYSDGGTLLGYNGSVNITGDYLINNTSLSSRINSKQDTLVNGTNIRSINGTSILGSGNIIISSGGGSWGTITGTLSNQTDLNTELTNINSTMAFILSNILIK